MHIPALLAIALTACPQAPVQEQQINARGMTTPKDIMLHGIIAGSSFQSNQGFTLQNGSSIHANTGLVLNSRNIVLNGGQVSSTNTASCSDNSGQGFCLNGKPKFVSPIITVPKPDIVALKAKYTAVPIVTIQGTLNLNSSSEITSRFDNKIVLVKGSVNLNAIATIKNAVLIIEETLKSNKGITLENSRIISKGAQFNQSTVLNNSRLITDEDLSFNGKIENTGISSVVSSKNLTTNQGVTSTSGELAVIANQNIVVNQSSSGKMALWAGGNVTLNQGGSLEGSVVAGGRVVLNQGVTLTKVLQHLNGDVLGGGGFENIPETLTLTDGGIIRFQNGIVIQAPLGSLRSPANITVTQVPESVLPLPLPNYYTRIGHFYKIQADRDFPARGRNGFLVSYPVFPNVDPATGLIADLYMLADGLLPDQTRDLWFGGGRSAVFENKVTQEMSAFFNTVNSYSTVVINTSSPRPQITASNSRINAASIRIEVVCERLVGFFCPLDWYEEYLYDVLRNMLSFDNIMNFSDDEFPPLKEVVLESTRSAKCVGGAGEYFPRIDTLLLCLDDAGRSYSQTVRHEVFHAVQDGLFTSNDIIFRSTWSNSWIIEGTATASELSFSEMNIQGNLDAFNIANPLDILPFPDPADRYRTQDFWVYVGRKLNKNLEYLKNIFRFQHGLLSDGKDFYLKTLRGIDQALISEGYQGGLKKAYQNWIQNRAIERKIPLRIGDLISNVPQYCIPLDSLTNQAGVVGLNLRAPESFPSVKNAASNNLSTQSTHIKFTSLGSRTPLGQVRIVARSSKSHVKFVFYERKRGDAPNQDCFDKVESSAPLVTNPASPDKNFYVFSQAYNVTEKSEFIILAVNPDFTETSDVQFRVEAVIPVLTVTNPITLTGNVGDTLEQNLTISNTGDLDSTLEYKQYFLSSNEITLPPRTPAPTPLAGAAARVQNAPTILPYPDEGELTPVGGNFLSPLSSSPDDKKLVVTESEPTPSAMIPVEYKCNTTGTFDALINVVYKTGATDDNGVEIQEKAVVYVQVKCLNPSTPDGNDNGSGGSGGEPWLSLYDGDFIGFHAVGEFTLSKNVNSGLNVQVRYVTGTTGEIADLSRLPEVSFNGAIAMQVGSDRIGVYARQGYSCITEFSEQICERQAEVRINGQVIAPPRGNTYDYAQVLPDGGVLSWYKYYVSIISPNRDEIVIVRLFGNHVGSVQIRVPEAQKGQYRGLLGNFDGNTSNDYVSQSGAEFVAPLSPDQLYLEWGESWRITQSESLFDYETGQSTASFTDRSFPRALIQLENLSPAAKTLGETACRTANIIDPRAFKACVLDVGLTGNTGWASVAKDLDPGSKRLLVAPLKTTVVTGERVRLNADVFGLTSTNVVWSATAGQIVPMSGFANQSQVEFIAPMQSGLYTIAVRSAEDSSLTGSIAVQVNQVVAPTIQRLAVGRNFNVLVNSNGTVSTWGLEMTNYSNTRNCSTRANPFVIGVTNVQSVAVGDNYAVAVLQNGNLMTWGTLAYATPESDNTYKSPVVFSESPDWVAVDAFKNVGQSSSVISLKRDGTAWVWLRVYLGFYDYILKPFLIQGVSDVVGLSNNLLLKRDGTVWAITISGNTETAYFVKANQVSGLTNVVQISSSQAGTSGHALALKSDGSIWAFGDNLFGQLGLGSTTQFETTPQRVLGLPGVTQIRTSSFNSYVLTSDGGVWAWGFNAYNFPLNGTTAVFAPSRISGVSNILDIQSSISHLILVQSDGSLLGWGDNYYQQIKCANEAFIRLPTLILGITW